MNSHLDRLIGVLRQELQLHLRLCALLEDECASLVGLRGDRLLELSREKDGVTLQLRALEESRRLSMESLAAELPLPNGENTALAELVEILEEPHASQLAELRTQLRQAVEQGQSRNEDNKFLINRSLEMVREAMRALSQADEARTYRGRRMPAAYQTTPQIVARQA